MMKAKESVISPKFHVSLLRQSAAHSQRHPNIDWIYARFVDFQEKHKNNEAKIFIFWRICKWKKAEQRKGKKIWTRHFIIRAHFTFFFQFEIRILVFSFPQEGRRKLLLFLFLPSNSKTQNTRLIHLLPKKGGWVSCSSFGRGTWNSLFKRNLKYFIRFVAEMSGKELRKILRMFTRAKTFSHNSN